MDEKTLTRVFEADVMALPPLRLVLGDVPSPDPEGPNGGPRRRPAALRIPARDSVEMAITVRRLISYLEKQQ
jgi:hypothetical protein